MQPRTLCFGSSTEPALSHAALIALKEACGPIELLNFPSIAIIRELRQRGYVTIVLGGLKVTPRGLEHLLHERERTRSANPKVHTSTIG